MNTTKLAELGARYRAIVASEWTIKAIDDVLRLIHDEILGAGWPMPFQWSGKRRGDNTYRAIHDCTQRLVQQWRNLTLQPTFGVLGAPYRSPGSQQKMELSHRAWKALVCLNFERFETLRNVEMPGYTTTQNSQAFSGLIRDTQCMLFQLSIDFLLPELKAKRLLHEASQLCNGLWLHVSLDWEDQPAQKFYLQSILFDYLNWDEAKREALLNAFKMSAPYEHDYLTKAQAIWFDLLDQKQSKEAMDFLLNLYRQAPAEHLSEIREMIRDTLLVKQKPRAGRETAA